jgi:hypothetical protein
VFLVSEIERKAKRKQAMMCGVCRRLGNSIASFLYFSFNSSLPLAQRTRNQKRGENNNRYITTIRQIFFGKTSIDKAGWLYVCLFWGRVYKRGMFGLASSSKSEAQSLFPLALSFPPLNNRQIFAWGLLFTESFASLKMV